MNAPAVTANANVLTASSSPVTRSAPDPMRAAMPATKTAASRIDRANGIGSKRM